jgi:hypothetical protein
VHSLLPSGEHRGAAETSGDVDEMLTGQAVVIGLSPGVQMFTLAGAPADAMLSSGC